MHFPDKVLENCFGCDIVGDILKLLYDSTFGLIGILEQPIEDVWDAGKLFWHALWLDEFFQYVYVLSESIPNLAICCIVRMVIAIDNPL